MSAPDRLPDEVLDDLAGGRPSDEADGSPLAAYLAALREDAVRTEATPNEALASVLAEGLVLEDVAVASPRPTWRRRLRLVQGAVAAKLAAASLLTKVATAGAAVTVAASGAGAAGVLPEPAQEVFDDAVGRQVEQPVVPGGDESPAPAAEQDAPAVPADTTTTPPLDSDVPGDATGSADDGPGVDGGSVADDASDGRAQVPDDAPPTERSSGTEGPSARPEAPGAAGDEAVGDAPSDSTPEDVPPSTVPTPSDTAGDAATSTGRD